MFTEYIVEKPTYQTNDKYPVKAWVSNKSCGINNAFNLIHETSNLQDLIVSEEFLNKIKTFETCQTKAQSDKIIIRGFNLAERKLIRQTVDRYKKN